MPHKYTIPAEPEVGTKVVTAEGEIWKREQGDWFWQHAVFSARKSWISLLEENGPLDDYVEPAKNGDVRKHFANHSFFGVFFDGVWYGYEILEDDKIIPWMNHKDPDRIGLYA